nr:MAG TPA: hypothetical protein [Caudoviricetes sp.]
MKKPICGWYLSSRQFARLGCKLCRLPVSTITGGLHRV